MFSDKGMPGEVSWRAQIASRRENLGEKLGADCGEKLGARPGQNRGKTGERVTPHTPTPFGSLVACLGMSNLCDRAEMFTTPALPKLLPPTDDAGNGGCS